MRGAVLDFLNDWRDSIFYGVVAVLSGLVWRKAGMLLGLGFGGLSFFWRELARDVVWVLWDNDWKGPRSDARDVMFLAPVVILLASDLGIGPHHSRIDVFSDCLLILINSALLVGPLLKVGLVGAVRIWWRELFDWPRKQKPPKHRWDVVKRKVVDALAKFQPDHVPHPCRVAIERRPARSYPERRPTYE